MDFGSWFSEEFAGTRVATLEEALEICRGKISMNIELKDNLISETLVDAGAGADRALRHGGARW